MVTGAPLHGAAFISCQRQVREGVRLFPLADRARGRRGETGYVISSGSIASKKRNADANTLMVSDAPVGCIGFSSLSRDVLHNPRQSES